MPRPRRVQDGVCNLLCLCVVVVVSVSYVVWLALSSGDVVSAVDQGHWPIGIALVHEVVLHLGVVADQLWGRGALFVVLSE